MPIFAPNSVISTHDLTKRSTSGLNNLRYIYLISTHDLTKRSTQASGRNAGVGTFQLTTSRRGRPATALVIFKASSFQLTTSRRGRQQKYTNHFMLLLINLAYFTKKTPLNYTQPYLFHSFFQQNLSKTRCESPTISCLLHTRTDRSSFQKIKVSVTSNPGLAPICSTLF